MSSKDSILELLAVSLDENLDDLVEFFDGLDIDWDTVTTDELVEALEYCTRDELSLESGLSLDCDYLTYVYEDLLADGEEFSPKGLLNFIKHNKSAGIDFYNAVIYEYIYNKLKHDGLIGCEYDEI